MRKKKKQTTGLIVTLFLIIATPFLLIGLKKITSFLSRATVKPANIIVDMSQILGPLPQSWRAIAQGGEERGRIFFSVRDELQELSPKYVRIDHVYDHFDVAKVENGELKLDWRQLDQTVIDIISTGALPFFSLSYMPVSLSVDGTVTGKPVDWNLWKSLVKATIEHYSGITEMNFQDIYYEIWNEPDLFGQWKTYGDKNYLDLYYFSAQAAGETQNTNRFFLGGPATTAPYRNWLVRFLQFVKEDNLRLDFISWHRYSNDPSQYQEDIQTVDSWIRDYTDYNSLPKVISEFCFDSENNPAHDNLIGAAHTVAVIREIVPDIELAFNFELKDGLSPEGKKFWGRWGILTHDQSNNEKKPRYFALKLLSELEGKRISVSGEGNFVKGIAATDFGNNIKLLLFNYDPQNKNTENVPVSFTNLAFPEYQIEQEDLDGNRLTNRRQVENGRLSYQVIMPANSVVLTTLSPAQ